MNLAPQYEAFLIQQVLDPFYADRLQKLQGLELKEVLSRKNPYLFRAKNIEVAGDLVKSTVDAYLSSQEETIFGNLLEAFAIFVSQTVDGGFKSKRKSLDLEFIRDGVYYIVGIKSGTNWGNADQQNIMRQNFKLAKQALSAEGWTGEIVAVNGCMYGKEAIALKVKTATRKKSDTIPVDPDLTYYKYAGQEFWEFISHDPMLYQRLILPIGIEARTRDEAYRQAYTSKVNAMTAAFIRDFLTHDSQIDWVKLVDFVSKKATKPPQSSTS